MRCYKSDFQRYNWIINNHTCHHHHHCNSIYNYRHQHCNNSIGYWGGFGAGLGNAVGNMLGVMFCNMSWMNPWTNLFCNMSWMNPWTNLLGNTKKSSCHCGCNDKKEPPTQTDQVKADQKKAKTQTDQGKATIETTTQPPAETTTQTTTEVDNNNDAGKSGNTNTTKGANFDSKNWENNNFNVSELNLGNLPEGYSTIDKEVENFNITKAIDITSSINDVIQRPEGATTEKAITKDKYPETNYPLYIQITDKNNNYQYKCIGISQDNIPIYATPDSDNNDNIYALVYDKTTEKQVLLQFGNMTGVGSGDNQIKNKEL